MKPRVTWIITALCLALLGGAMAWITHSMVRMESEQNRMANNATVQEMARLALWRMESIASKLVFAESGRPAEQYRTFTVPESVLNSSTLLPDANNGWALSPVVRDQPDFLKLHFEMDANGSLRSPQVPVGLELAVCRSAHVVPDKVIAGNTANLAEFCRVVDVANDGGKLKEMRENLRCPPTLDGNRALIWSNANNEPPAPVAPQPAPEPVPTPGPAAVSNAAQAPGVPQTLNNARNVRTENTPSYAMQQRAGKPEEAQQQQMEYNSAEEKARAEFFQSGVGQAARSRAASNLDSALTKQTLDPKAPSTKPAAPLAAADRTIAAADKTDGNEKKGKDSNWAASFLNKVWRQDGTAEANTAPPADGAAHKQAVADDAPVLPPAAKAATPAAEAAPVQEIVTVQPPPPRRGSAVSPATTPAPSNQGAVAEVTEFTPLWLGDALLLTRRVTTPQRQWIQGVWLDWERLRAELLVAVQDRFPEAQVVEASREPERGAHLLVSLPIQLIPGAVSFPPAPFWSPLKVSLSIAWLCVLLAVAAVALVLRGMMSLSERRASFVSSVTHELRTPLATFKIYSEMLADGMVKEEAKKQQYLETLTGEADRLGHLVENVLAYSRIERGKGPTAAASVRTGDLVARIEPRLNQRTLMAGMDFNMNAAPGTLEAPLRTDAGAVEQILCNLVDNACKYGRRDGVPGKVELVITRERRRLCLAVRDHGPGIAGGEQNTIFLPFHKSARDAAHSAPGVGLGLALCRRLAAELRGTLEIDRSWKQGACFVLRLPV